MIEKQSIADLRREYAYAGLRRADLDVDPIVQFSKWLEQAVAAGLHDPNAMTLSTVDAAGQPSGRIVLLKAVDQNGFSFFTNYGSRKGSELAGNPKVSLVFFWPEFERQVCITGTASKVSREMSEQYFKSRPKGSRLAAWVSSQSEAIANRAVLEKKLEELIAKHPGENVPLPPYWGGYCVAPSSIEFWQGRPNRLHDRFVYVRQARGGWVLERLSP
ncbi:MAG TPA: pyridoxamine 5'-phosphate oxidase [Verrucomicrobiae bacterium]|nr:pyridoxamine 5'-phosphate oxidase [Verrucomicrobiae bacterium]